MKKFLLILAVFFINTKVVLAETSAYLSSLEIKGYELSPTFNKYNNSYSVNIDSKDTKLDINYTLEDPNSEVEILDNDLITENSIVTIKVVNQDQIQVYKIHVNKLQEENVDLIKDNMKELSIPKKYNKKIVVGIITTIYIFLILLIRRIMFGRLIKK